MREIKFRGKRIDYGEWAYGFLVVDESGENNIVDNVGTSYFWDEVEPETVSQYTNIKDRNGKEIYEGDIVTRHEGGIHFYEEPLAIHQVTFGEVGWAPFEWIAGSGRGPHDFYKNVYEFIVIGNIYENPNWESESHEVD